MKEPLPTIDFDDIRREVENIRHTQLIVLMGNPSLADTFTSKHMKWLCDTLEQTIKTLKAAQDLLLALTSED